MIRFLTLLTGFLIGPQTVHLEVSPPVEVVEIRLDGERVAVLGEEPWTATVDLSERLEPHLLEAVGFDPGGIPVDRATALVNYRRPLQEAILVLNRDPSGRPTSGTVRWEARHGRAPRSVTVRLDGRKIDADRRGRFDLPPLDLADVHVLEAEVRFPELEVESDWQIDPELGYNPADPGNPRRRTRVRRRQTFSVEASEASATLVFGGEHGDVATSALTPVPVLWSGTGSPTPDDIELQIGDEALEIFSVDRGSARVYVVRDRGAADAFGDASEGADIAGVAAFGSGPVTIFEVSRRPLEDRGGFLAVETASGVDSPAGLARRLESSDPFFTRKKDPSRLWDAVAVAGERAARSDAPRAVVLLVGPKGGDGSHLSPDLARGYLSATSVPFYAWRPAPEEGPSAGGSTFVGPDGLRELLRELGRSLSEQWVVWVRGQHAPHRIELVGSARELSIVR